MKDSNKKHKHIDDLLDDYFDLSTESANLLLMLAKERDEYKIMLEASEEAAFKKGELGDIFKQYLQIKKLEEKRGEINGELEETTIMLKEFLQSLSGHSIYFERKNNGEKSKTAYVISELNGEIQAEKQS